MVINSHFLQYFLPSLASGNPAASILPDQLEVTYYNLPGNIFYNGKAAIALFFVLSGFVMTYKFFRDRKSEILVSSAMRRYPRLAIPILALVVLIFIMNHMSLFSPSAMLSAQRNDLNSILIVWDRSDAVSLPVMLFEALIRSFFQYSGKYTVILWVMTYEFFGSLAVMATAYLAVQIRKRWIIYLIILLALFSGKDAAQYYSRFFLGMILADFFVNFPTIKHQWLIGVFGGLIGFFLLTYPRLGLYSGVTSIYNILPISQLEDTTLFWQTMGAALFIAAILYSRPLQLVLETRPLQFLARISYSAFLFHLVVLGSFSAGLYLWVRSHLSLSFGWTLVLVYTTTILVIVILSYVFTRLIDEPGIRLSHYLYERFFRISPGKVESPRE